MCQILENIRQMFMTMTCNYIHVLTKTNTIDMENAVIFVNAL